MPPRCTAAFAALKPLARTRAAARAGHAAANTATQAPTEQPAAPRATLPPAAPRRPSDRDSRRAAAGRGGLQASGRGEIDEALRTMLAPDVEASCAQNLLGGLGEVLPPRNDQPTETARTELPLTETQPTEAQPTEPESSVCAPGLSSPRPASHKPPRSEPRKSGSADPYRRFPASFSDLPARGVHVPLWRNEDYHSLPGPSTVWGSVASTAYDTVTSDVVRHYREVVLNNLPWDFDEKDVWDLIKDCGPVVHVHVSREIHGCSRGFAYVTMATETGALLAVENVNGVVRHEYRISVRMSDRIEQGIPEVYGHPHLIRVHPLPVNATRGGLTDLFGRVATVVACSFPKHDDGLEQNFALVAMLDADGARKAVRDLHMTRHLNTPIKVCLLRPSDKTIRLRSVGIRFGRNPGKSYVDPTLVTDETTLDDILEGANLPEISVPPGKHLVFRSADGIVVPPSRALAKMVTFTEHLDLFVGLEKKPIFDWSDF